MVRGIELRLYVPNQEKKKERKRFETDLGKGSQLPDFSHFNIVLHLVS